MLTALFLVIGVILFGGVLMYLFATTVERTRERREKARNNKD